MKMGPIGHKEGASDYVVPMVDGLVGLPFSTDEHIISQKKTKGTYPTQWLGIVKETKAMVDIDFLLFLMGFFTLFKHSQVIVRDIYQCKDDLGELINIGIMDNPIGAGLVQFFP